MIHQPTITSPSELTEALEAAGFPVLTVPGMEAPIAVWPALADGTRPIFVASWVEPAERDRLLRGALMSYRERAEA